MRKISANYIFPVSLPPIKNGIVVFDDNNTITEIIDRGNDFVEQANLEFYNGVLIPGFIIDDNRNISDTLHHEMQNTLTNIYKILNENPNVSFHDLLYEYTIKKAQLNNSDKIFGSLEFGKSPGLYLICPFNFQKFTLTKESKIKQLV